MDIARHDKMVALVERMLALHQKLAAATVPTDKYEPTVRLYQRQIEVTDQQIDALSPAQQRAGASCMGCRRRRLPFVEGN